MRTSLIIITLLIYISFRANAQEGILFSKKYTPSFTSGSVKRYLRDIEKQTGTSISYSDAYVNSKLIIKMQQAEQTVLNALQVILAGQDVSFKESGEKILVVSGDDATIYNKSAITINGYVKEQVNGEVLIGAAVYIPSLSVGTVTNSYGYYSLTVPSGKYKVLCAYVGYKTDTFTLAGNENLRRDILLPAQQTLNEINIVSSKETSADHTHLIYGDIKSKPAIMGENDVMRALQNISGVQTGTDGMNAVLVRGGDPGQNLNLLDGVPLYYIDHFFGLTSVFNTEAIKSVDFHKGAFPSRYGGRLSSVIDVNTKDGDMHRWGGQFSMGLIKGSLNVEGPIIKDKASVMLSARRTWFDLLWRPFTKALTVNFYDVNGKANYILDKNNRLYVSVYNGRDGVGFESKGNGTKALWGNTVASAKWNRIVNPKLFLNTVVTYSRFSYYLQDKKQLIDKNSVSNSGLYEGNSSINDIALRMYANWYPTSSQRVEMGMSFSRARFIPAELTSQNTQNLSSGAIMPADKFLSNELVLFVEDEIKINDRWSIRPGMHLANWFSDRFNYSSLQPRFYTNYKLALAHSVYFSYTRMAQFLHLINNNTYGLPTDFWLPSSDKIEPEGAHLLTAGYAAKPGRISYNIEGYYKYLNNTTTYSMGKNLFDNSLKWDEKIIQGTGWSYGGEVSGKIKFGGFTFNAAYTLSWTWRKFAQLNDGKAFPYRYDRRHNIHTSLLFRPSEKFSAAVSWAYMTGEAITLPDQVYPDLDNNLLISPSTATSSSSYTYNYVKWNNYRLPAIHRLDFEIDFIKKKRKHYERTWSIGIFNAYGRKNVMYVELTSISGDPGASGFKLRGTSILQYIPYISYQLKF